MKTWRIDCGEAASLILIIQQKVQFESFFPTIQDIKVLCNMFKTYGYSIWLDRDFDEKIYKLEGDTFIPIRPDKVRGILAYCGLTVLELINNEEFILSLMIAILNDKIAKEEQNLLQRKELFLNMQDRLEAIKNNNPTR